MFAMLNTSVAVIPRPTKQCEMKNLMGKVECVGQPEMGTRLRKLKEKLFQIWTYVLKKVFDVFVRNYSYPNIWCL